MLLCHKNMSMFRVKIKSYLFFFCPLVQNIFCEIKMPRDLGEFEVMFNGIIVSKVFRVTCLVCMAVSSDYSRVAPG